MATVLLKELSIGNLGPIVSDKVLPSEFTFFIGRNNAGKSHYIRAVELLLAAKAPSAAEIAKLQHDPEKAISIEGRSPGWQPSRIS
jgi:AAA15 family ATPase/GTPase